MAPAKSNKRAADSTVSPAVKKAKSNPQFKKIAGAIEKLDTLTDDCREMLLAMIPGSLGVAFRDRHPHQNLAVEVIGKALATLQANMQLQVDAENKQVTDFEGKKADFEANAAAAEAALAAAVEVVKTKKMGVASAQKDLVAAKTALSQAESAQRQGVESLAQVKKDKTALTAAIDNDFQVLKAGELEAPQVKTRMATFMPVVKLIAIDDSLMTALPTACTVKQAERGIFDNMVMDELEKKMHSKVEELDKMLADGEPVAAERLEAVTAATTGFATAQSALQEAKDSQKNSQTAQDEAASAVKAAKTALANYEPLYQEATVVRDEKVAALDDFITNDLECFNALRDKEKAADSAARARQVVAAATEADGSRAASDEAAKEPEAVEQSS